MLLTTTATGDVEENGQRNQCYLLWQNGIVMQC